MEMIGYPCPKFYWLYPILYMDMITGACRKLYLSLASLCYGKIEHKKVYHAFNKLLGQPAISFWYFIGQSLNQFGRRPYISMIHGC